MARVNEMNKADEKELSYKIRKKDLLPKDDRAQSFNIAPGPSKGLKGLTSIKDFVDAVVPAQSSDYYEDVIRILTGQVTEKSKTKMTPKQEELVKE